MSRTLAIFISLAISLGILGYLAVTLDWVEFGRQLQRIDPLPLLGVLVVFTVQYYLRGVRWRLLLPSEFRPSATALKLTEATVLGTVASFLLPLRGGEFVRPWVLTRWVAIPFSAAFASIVIERVFDVLALFALIALCAPYLTGLPDVVVLGMKSLGLIAIVIAVVMIWAYVSASSLLLFGEKVVGATVARVSPAISAKIMQIGREFVDGLKGVSGLADLILIIFWSLVTWLSYAATYQLFLWSFGEFPSWIAGVVITVMIALAVAAPSAPAFIGTLQAGCVLALSTVFSYSEEFAVAYSLVVHVLTVLHTCVLGFVTLQYEGLSLRDVTQSRGLSKS